MAKKLITILKWKKICGRVIREQVVDNTAYQAIRTQTPVKKHVKMLLLIRLKAN